MINISKKNKAEVLAALYNGSRPLGMGFLHYTPNDMTIEEAESYLKSGKTYFDYLNGKVMKVDLGGNELETFLYNRDNGDGAAERIINKLGDVK